MQEDKYGVGIRRTNGIKREDVVRRFQEPAPAGLLPIQMPQKPFVETVRVGVIAAADPCLIGR